MMYINKLLNWQEVVSNTEQEGNNHIAKHKNRIEKINNNRL